MRSVTRLLVVMVWLSAVALPAAAASDTSQHTLSVTDFRGQRVTLAQPARRIVCLIESALSGLYMLGAQGAVAGISTNVYEAAVFPYYAAMDARIRQHALPTPGNWDFVNIESVLALAPDLVIIWAHQSEAITALEEKGIPVFGVFISRLEDIYAEMESLGTLTGKADRARVLNRYTRNELARFASQAKNAGQARPGVYFMWAQSELATSGGSSTVNELIDLAGGRNVFSDLNQEHAAVNLESLLLRNPQVILMWPSPTRSPDEITAMPAWQTLAAVQSGRVYALPSVFFCDLWTLKFQYAVKRLAGWCYPERFGALDWRSEKRAMLENLFGPKLSERIPLEE
jgi:iron complex transport system substrate-binding protein